VRTSHKKGGTPKIRKGLCFCRPTRLKKRIALFFCTALCEKQHAILKLPLERVYHAACRGHFLFAQNPQVFGVFFGRMRQGQLWVRRIYVEGEETLHPHTLPGSGQ